MHDALLDMRAQLRASGDLLIISPESAEARASDCGEVLVTLHRPSNTDDPAQLARVLHALARIRRPVCWPMHPRTRAALVRHRLRVPSHVRVEEPFGYRALVCALDGAWAVVTDSGGLQKEAYWLGTPCLTLRTETEWVETVASGWNRLVDLNADDLAALVEAVHRPDGARDAYGSVGAASRIVKTIERRFGGVCRAAA